VTRSSKSAPRVMSDRPVHCRDRRVRCRACRAGETQRMLIGAGSPRAISVVTKASNHSVGERAQRIGRARFRIPQPA